MTEDETYRVELTFRDWMEISSALALATQRYEKADMQGTANNQKEIRSKIADQLSGDYEQ